MKERENQGFEVWIRRIIKIIQWIGRVSDEQVLNRINDNKILLDIIVKWKAD